MNQQFYKNMALWVVIVVMILLLVTMLREGQTPPPELAFSEFLQRVDGGEVQKVTIEDGRILGTFSSGDSFSSYAPVVTEGLLERLEEHRVEYDARPKPEAGFWRQVLIMWFPLLLFIGLWIFFIRQMQAGGGKAMSFGKSCAAADREPAPGHLR